MKKLVCAAFVAASMCAMADEAAKPAAPAAPAAAPAVAEAPKPAVRGAFTEEQRAKIREQREKFMAERRAAMEAKLLEVAKKYVPDEEKAKALVRDFEEAMRSSRRPGMNRPPMTGRRPLPPPAAPAAPAPAAK